jgi:anti-sigma factor RsiW
MKHLTEATLALYAGGDLGLWGRLRIAQHLQRCERCSRQVEEFRGIREFLGAQQDELPSGFAWSEAAAGMKANIRLGIAAGECVASEEPERAGMGWRAPALALPVLLMIVVGWILQSVPPPLNLVTVPGSGPAAVVLDASSAGIGVEQDGRGFRLLQPLAAQNVEVSVRGDSVRSRYVDGETGQVTISHVSAE